MRLEFKDNAHAPVELVPGRFTVGRDASNAIVLKESGVSGFHAELHSENGRFFVVDLGSTNGTEINGEKISGRREIKAWDRLKFDSVECELVDPDGRRPTQVRAAISDAMLQEKKKEKGAASGTRVRPAVSAWSLVSEPEGKSVALEGRTVFGRDSGCDVVLQSAEVSRRHAEVVVEGMGLKVRDLGSANGTYVNGKRVTESPLRGGDELRFDQSRFRVVGGQQSGEAGQTSVRPALQQADPSGADTDFSPQSSFGTQVQSSIPIARARLVGISGGLTGRQFDVVPPATLGRNKDNTIVIDDPTVSARHARLGEVAERWQLEDLASTNGVFINGKKIDTGALENGDRVLIGKVEFRFETEPATTADAAPGSAAHDTFAPPRPAAQPASSHAIPAWVYAVGGFVVVTLLASLVLFRDHLPFRNEGMVDAPLQAGAVWAQTLPDERQAPSTPVIADINGDGVLDIIVADAKGFVLALDGEEGKRIFDVDVADRILAPLVAGDLTGDRKPDIVVGTQGGTVLALDGRGQILWRAGDLELGTVVNRPVLHDVNGDGVPDVIVPSTDRGLVALDGARGWKLWDTAEMTRGEVVTSPLAVDVNRDGIVDFVSVTDRGHLMAVSAQGNRVWQLWQAEVPEVLYASPAFARLEEGGLVIAATRSGLTAVRADSGRLAWQTSLSGGFVASPVVADLSGDGLPEVVAITQGGKMYVLNASNGDEIWSASLGTRVLASPALFDFSGNRLPDILVLGRDGTLRVIDGVRGREKLQVRVAHSDEFIASPLLADITGDGLLDVVGASHNGRISVYGFNRTVHTAAAPWPVFLGHDGRRTPGR
ncbi:hypothetical protein CKO15_05635 [Halorhodospira abdelmalekii]|uniref:FHA domain-containing protein n=1 Tax=Halorhodospira abdelmalekii TaxID=421629 RepID=UPI001903B9EC|nr:FHA domain-containing protein [Halorhodospira abdelmalekii]MBK1734778.1 hypothetical protein [Halorhodospira abdelmalekii]